MTDNLEHDFREVYSKDVATSFRSETQIEIVDRFVPSVRAEYVLFDFDGTLSLIREGWADIMICMMVSELKATGTQETDESLKQLCRKFVADLTGKQTIYQMIRLAEEITQRGGAAREANDYKHQYHELLMQKIIERRDGLRDGSIDRERYLVPGSVQLLNRLVHEGCELFLASGTDETYVREEVQLLGLEDYFGPHVYGAKDDYKSFSKAQVIARILEEQSVRPKALLGFGDGYVEIQNVRDVGGVAIGVASDEAHRSGQADVWKRSRLISAGAHAIVPDFSQADDICDWLFEPS